MNDRKIAVFMATSGHSGVDRAMKNLIPALAGRGYEIDLLHVRNHGPNLDTIPPGVRIVDLGAKHVYTSLPAVIRYLRHECPVAMLSDKDRVNRTAFVAWKISGAPSRLTFSNGTTLSIDLKDRSSFDRWLHRFSIRNLYPRVHRYIVTCQGVLEDMADYTGIGRACIQVVASPVVAESLFHDSQPRPDHPWFGSDQPPVILGLGELSQRKDFETLLRAFALVRSEQPCRLLILGRGRRQNALLSIASELGVADDFALPGFVDNPYPYLAHAAVFGFTSRMEGLGFVIIEALAVGTPVVATDCPHGPREIVQNGKYGSLVPVGDVEAVAQALLVNLRAPRPDKAFLQEAAWPYEIEGSTTAYLEAMGLEPFPRG